MIARAYILHDDTPVLASVKSTDELVKRAEELIRKDNERAERERSLLAKKPEETNNKKRFVLPSRKLCAPPQPAPAASVLSPEERRSARLQGLTDEQAILSRDIGSPQKLALSADELRVAKAMGASDLQALKAHRR